VLRIWLNMNYEVRLKSKNLAWQHCWDTNQRCTLHCTVYCCSGSGVQESTPAVL